MKAVLDSFLIRVFFIIIQFNIDIYEPKLVLCLPNPNLPLYKFVLIQIYMIVCPDPAAFIAYICHEFKGFICIILHKCKCNLEEMLVQKGEMTEDEILKIIALICLPLENLH